MHHGLLFAGILALVAFAFGERAARAVAIVACVGLAAGGLFFLFVLYCAVRQL
jgi:hypothetical protein